MQNLPFDKPGRFWRGNLHTHSNNSDGRLSPEAVCQLYREAGYDFLSITDHFMKRYEFPLTDTQPYQSEGFVTLVGAELHAGETEFGSFWHILAVGLPPDFQQTPSNETGPELAQRAVRAGAFVAVAHPAWYSLTENDVHSLGDVHAIEVFNGTSHDHNDRAESWHMAHIMLSRGKRYSLCATDDAHFHPYRLDACVGWVWVKAESLDADSILDALKLGHYYSSTGPEIYDIKVAGSMLYVRCSPVERVFITGIGSRSEYVQGAHIRDAAIDLSQFDSPYGVVTVRDRLGKKAWSNPIWFE